MKPYDKILCRDSEDEIWSCDFYEYEDDTTYHTLLGGEYNKAYAQVIPFEGNEELVGTNDSKAAPLITQDELCFGADEIEPILTTSCIIGHFRGIKNDTFETDDYYMKYCLPFKHFRPELSRAELKKHILEVKDGKIQHVQ